MIIFFTSDTHFDHANILTFKRSDGSPLRPFASVEEMNETIIERWNSVVKTSDHIYHLGDVTMARGKATKHIDQIMSRLNGHKRICLGNHDQLVSGWYFKWFEKVKACNVLDGIIFTHIPIHPESLGRFRACVHGHLHANRVLASPHHPDPRYINICVEHTDYTPVPLEELTARVGREASAERPVRHSNE